MRIITILIRAGTTAYPTAEADASAIVASTLPGVERDLLVVDNALPVTHLEHDARRMVIGGDNSSWEFSAIDRAVAFLGAAIHEYDLVHIVTSAFNTLYTAYLPRFSPAVLEFVAARPACVGHIDCYNEPVRLLHFRSQHWIRTAYFFLPPAELAALRSAVSVTDPSRFFDPASNAPFRPDAPICETYRRYIIDWLSGGDVGQGVVWHSRLTTDPAGLTALRAKATAILNEHLFSIRLRAAGCRLVDVTWLSGMLKRGPDVDIETPWWRQLETREADVVVPTTR